MPDPLYVAVRPRVERLLGLQERELGFLLASGRFGRRRFVDVGANWGSYSVLLAPRFARVDSFEPIARCATAIERYAGRSGKIRVHACALSDREETVTLVVPDDSAVDQSGRARVVAGESASGISVAAKTLDSFAFDDVDLMKIDVEGHERQVVAGSLATIARCRPTLLIEIEQRHIEEPLLDRIAYVESFGYRASFVRDGALVPARSLDVARDQDPASAGTGRPYVNNFFFEPLSADGTAPGATG